MTTGTRAVAVRQLPEKLSMRKARNFLRETESILRVDRPRIVLDCSNVRQVNRPVIHLMLQCLEEAMKRNGDVKLASIPPGGEAILDLTGVSRLFDIFETAADAVDSFHHPSIDGVSQRMTSGRPPRESESAA